MFPLGTALLPSAELPLRIFEPRYRQMLSDHVDTSADPPTASFGVVLIARGVEVGGGDVRCDVGAMAHAEITDRFPDGRADLTCTGTYRFRIVEWLPDDPYPRARVQRLPEQTPTPADLARLDAMNQRLYSLMRQKFEFEGQDPEPVIAALAIMDADPAIAGISPIHRFAGRVTSQPHDQQRLLEADAPAGQLDVLDDVLDGMEARLHFGR
ncbi:peptidase S16 [Gordonia jinghuaiqii]|uniref:LON peptidase substrate-binding domain-containing protein n=1 Tax=Gordonia jinghuaiqii TaxID=2758710 RepID=A0A7D7LWU2_9ACTN|nr:LON peptidase substrate-binding domain-containing protein [Gordonia jinghuaiqii]MCR5977711.1 peptidase S16 [Gordonia jinghuaiqii]QMT02375.1 LON peptidase substrate-binding domain-containing protein [Gordonia jinghuaiqii]